MQQDQQNNCNQTFDYKETLNLPTTSFPMKANLASQELKILAFWQELDLYNLLQKFHQADPAFTLQDGPPYANGDLHLGHAFNKILKDFIVKTKSFSGYRVPFVPGWDCHGLPIEIQVEKSLGKQSHQLDPIEFITNCRSYAQSQVIRQKQQFIRLGTLAAWQDPYITMAPQYVATVIRTLASILKNGHIVRGDRPVHWCFNCGSALAEAEVEYKNKRSPSIYVGFTCKDRAKLIASFAGAAAQIPPDREVLIIIWTTTPWTLPANQGVAVNANFEYALCYSDQLQKYFIVATKLVTAVAAILKITNYQIIKTCLGQDLEGLKLQHPFYAKEVMLMLGEHVSLEAGTGCVHIAPAHGYEDYLLGKKYNLPINNEITPHGCFRTGLPLFGGMHLTKATPDLLATLTAKEKLLANTEIEHSHAHCWRHKTPLVYMATPQWFISMEANHLRAKALAAIDQVQWFPAWGKTRMQAMLQPGRSDWCISRQRVWGTPIPFIFHKTTGQLHPKQLELLETVAKQVAVGGIEAWHNLDLEELLGRDAAAEYAKSNDILDVWFESGAVNCCVPVTHPQILELADLYLEGSDQHRGWFQASLLVAMAARDAIPFKQVLTHGFILDQFGNKMSKSLGNVITPNDLIQKYGADLLRLWVATTDYSGDLKISEEVLTRVVDGYRRIRNTFRFLLANLYDFDPAVDLVPVTEQLLLDQKIVELGAKLQQELIQDFNEYKYHLAYQKILNFCSQELGGFYLDVVKDRQYTCKKISLPRRSCQTTLYYLLQAMVRWIAPILSFTAEEIWQIIPYKNSASIFLTTWFAAWPDLAVVDLRTAEFWEILFKVKKELNKQVEATRNAGIIGSGLEAKVEIVCGSTVFASLTALQPELKFLFITAKVELDQDLKLDPDHYNIQITATDDPKCARCWHRVETLDQAKLCDRCRINLTTQTGEIRKYA